jgi:hypothetical protein
MKTQYPTVIRFGNIPASRRVCCDCSSELYGRSHFFVTSPARGKYLCPECCRKREAPDAPR